MKITRLRLRELTGAFESDSEYWEERLQRPIDVYPEHRAVQDNFGVPVRQDDGRLRIRSVFLEIETDEGITGLAGPVSHETAYQINQVFTRLLIGEDPTANERLWDIMYRDAVHGRKGVAMMAISAIDCALWDLKGRWLGQPVHRLLGGPVRKSIPAYASALGFSIEPEAVARQARAFIDEGYTATKWFPRGAPTDGRAGIHRNVELARTLREAIGPDNDFMLDAWMSWDAAYTAEIAGLVAQYRPRWLEEPTMPDQIEACAEARRRSAPVPIATGEHEYTRWGIKQLLDAGACDVLQPDTYWAGGITEMVKIAALASCYGIPIIPHGHSVPANIQLSAALPIPQVPLVEFLVKWNGVHQYFFANPVVPVNGIVTVPDVPGMGVELDPAKIEQERDLDWTDHATATSSTRQAG
ncbi:MAG TPA: enolase C-terminal domain-like protein [Thermomicrobiales bacterium]|jgi:L-alanine-DL-glutamate epimerase-like enolase superfamily enzyme|nr:enolase C-terminal domain-like protein [Thermomicrobiales bacterium]